MSTNNNLSQENLEEIKEAFNAIDLDHNGFITGKELGAVLADVGIKLPGYQVRELIEKHDTINKDGKLSFEEFLNLYAALKKDRDMGALFQKSIKPASGVKYIPQTDKSACGTTHMIKNTETVAFSNWINKNFEDDPDCKKYLPINPESNDLFLKCNDGIILCKLVNLSQPGTVDERTINRGTKLSIYQIHENLILALNSASAIGCNIINIGPDDLYAATPHLVLGLLWQIIRYGLFANIDLHNHPGLAVLLRDGESLEDFMKLSPEQILIRWVNYHLGRSTCGLQISNFTSDIKDSIAYIHLLHQIAPADSDVNTLPEHESDLTMRAERMLQEADKIECRAFVSPDDVVKGNYKLNIAFVANLFNMYPALDQPANIDLTFIHPETREEKMYRNWMNSMGVSPFVSRLYNDLTDGLIIFQLYDIIKANTVDWNRVIKKFNKMRIMMEKIENCNYAIELGKHCKFSLVGIDGKNIYDGNETLTLALVWQLMKAYTLSMLTALTGTGHPVVESEIVSWANEKLKTAGKTRKITGFNDPNISNGRVVIDLTDACKPGCVNYDNMKMGESDEDKLANATYAISVARKIGARVFALPDDIVEVKPKMVLTIFACLMIRDLQPQKGK